MFVSDKETTFKFNREIKTSKHLGSVPAPDDGKHRNRNNNYVMELIKSQHQVRFREDLDNDSGEIIHPLGKCCMRLNYPHLVKFIRSKVRA